MRIPAAFILCALLPALLPTGARAQTAPRAAENPPEERLSASEREARVKAQLTKMSDLSSQVERLAAQARQERDIVKLNCVSEELGQGRGLVRVSETAASDMKDANARRDDDASQHAFNKATIAASKVSQLRQDAEQCIGQLAYYNDEKTVVEVETPKDLPTNDPTWVPLPTGVTSRSPPGSGF
ncbi:MAG: hypothetical protein JST92_07430 [Deltaproteobacteria bacterium]|nr:hypothetical protein [Deltaproteobacteria bacterium]